ncbi:MAG: D-2-hydroxyacid dehydrogenase [Ruminococcaceae bacterium]|nr:D-2-hydroxyacid dehydrogenase [Oscillospiraceae bacterium]
MKIVITDAMTVSQGDIDLNIFSKFGELVIYQSTMPDEISERIADADIILCNKTPLFEPVLKNAKNLKYIGLFATGYNNIDIPYCAANGITVCNAGSYSTEAVAQHTFALILEHYTKVGKYNEFVQDGGWSASPCFSPFVFATDELYEKNIGIIGYGSIGQKVADIALAFGMKVKVFTRTKIGDPRVEFLSFDDLLASSDIITVHCPLTAQTDKLMNYDAFCKCKRDALYINTARGGINDENGLARALKEGKIAGAAIDVLTNEPMTKDCPLIGIPNLIVTPHVAWAPLSTRKRLMGIVEDNIQSFINKSPKNVVS